MKKKTSWKLIEGALRRAAVSSKIPPRDEFWTEFRAKADRRTVEEPVPGTMWTPVLRWAAVGALVSFLVLLGLFFPHMTTGRKTDLSEILSVHVVASHSALLIMRDQDTQSTIVWVVDLTEKSDAGDVL